MDDRPYLSMALLAYNERHSIESAAHRSSVALERCGRPYELILVDDGSTDGSAETMDRLAGELPFCHVIHHSAHRGLGAAIRTAYFRGQGEWATWFPADLQADPADLPGLVERLEQCDALVTYREALQRRASVGRKLVSWFDRMLVRFLFGIKLRDLHWVRFFRRRLLEQMRLKSQSPSIDTEMVFQARRLGARILELPLQDHPRTAGKAKGAGLSNILRSFRDLLILWARDRFARISAWSPGMKQEATQSTEESSSLFGLEEHPFPHGRGAAGEREGPRCGRENGRVNSDHSVLSVPSCSANVPARPRAKDRSRSVIK
jgi:glycosyltransferase involved in cell wall biosynthesis